RRVWHGSEGIRGWTESSRFWPGVILAPVGADHPSPPPNGHSPRGRRHRNRETVPMKHPCVWLLAVVPALSACSLPFQQSPVERKVECDRLAAQAIETTSLEDARDFANAAARCYSDAL